MKPSLLSRFALLTLSSAILFGANAMGAVIYTETFPNSTGSNIGLNTSGINWASYDGNTATNTSGNTVPGSGFTVSSAAGSGGDMGFVLKAGSSGKGLAFTSDFTPINRSLTEISSFSFDLSNANTATTFFVAIQLDVSGTPTWFVNASPFSATTTNVWESKTLNFTTAASSWYSLTVNPGVSLAVGSVLTNPLPTGNLLSAGLYATGGTLTGGGPTSNMRFDNFQIAVVPEPATTALLGLGLLAVLFRRRQRVI